MYLTVPNRDGRSLSVATGVFLPLTIPPLQQAQVLLAPYLGHRHISSGHTGSQVLAPLPCLSGLLLPSPGEAKVVSLKCGFNPPLAPCIALSLGCVNHGLLGPAPTPGSKVTPPCHHVMLVCNSMITCAHLRVSPRPPSPLRAFQKQGHVPPQSHSVP